MCATECVKIYSALLDIYFCEWIVWHVRGKLIYMFVSHRKKTSTEELTQVSCQVIWAFLFIFFNARRSLYSVRSVTALRILTNWCNLVILTLSRFLVQFKNRGSSIIFLISELCLTLTAVLFLRRARWQNCSISQPQRQRSQEPVIRQKGPSARRSPRRVRPRTSVQAAWRYRWRCYYEWQLAGQQLTEQIVSFCFYVLAWFFNV